LEYSLEVTENFSKQYNKLIKKNKQLQLSLEKKVLFLQDNPSSSKSLTYPMQGNRRVHICGCFVLIFEVDENKKIIILKRIMHHDQAYKKELD